MRCIVGEGGGEQLRGCKQCGNVTGYSAGQSQSRCGVFVCGDVSEEGGVCGLYCMRGRMTLQRSVWVYGEGGDYPHISP